MQPIILFKDISCNNSYTFVLHANAKRRSSHFSEEFDDVLHVCGFVWRKTRTVKIVIKHSDQFIFSLHSDVVRFSVISGPDTDGNTKLCCRGFILALFQGTTANKVDAEHT